jgi:hypothetical protein
LPVKSVRESSQKLSFKSDDFLMDDSYEYTEYKEKANEVTNLSLKVLYRESGGLKACFILTICFCSFGFLGVYINK